jgi:hypothetical protein
MSGKATNQALGGLAAFQRSCFTKRTDVECLSINRATHPPIRATGLRYGFLRCFCGTRATNHGQRSRVVEESPKV